MADFNIRLLDELLGSELILGEIDKLAGEFPVYQEAQKQYEKALEPAIAHLDWQQQDAIDCAHTLCASVYGQMGVVIGMKVMSSLQNAQPNMQTLGNLIVQRMHRMDKECRDEKEVP